MPRRHRRNPEFFAPQEAPRPRSAPPPWAELSGYEVRHVVGEREYRCPGCDHLVRVGTWHLVAIPVDAPDERRHWHTECWRKELRRIGAYRPGG